MSDSGWRKCKYCKRPFPLTKADYQRVSRRRLGTKRYSLPTHCPDCRPQKRLRDRLLAMTNFPIPGSRHGDGCFEELVASDLPDLESWWPEPEVGSPPVFLREEKKRLVQFFLLGPSWIERIVEPAQPARYPWRSVTSTSAGEAPRIIRFSVEDRLTGVAWLRDMPQGLAIWWLDWAPWASEYENASLSLLSYAVQESIRQGDGGRTLVRSGLLNKAPFGELDCHPTQQSTLLEFPASSAWRLILSVHGVSQPVVRTLAQRASSEEVDLPWLAQRIGRGDISPEFVEAFTRLAHRFNWCDIQRLAIDRRNVPDQIKVPLRREVRSVVGALAIRSFFEELGAEVDYAEGIPTWGQIVRPSEKIEIRCQRLTGEGQYSLWIRPGDEAMVFCRICTQRDNTIKELDQVSEMLAGSREVGTHAILSISHDFHKLGKARQQSILRVTARSKAHLFVLPDLAKKFLEDAKEVLSCLEPKGQQLTSTKD